MQSTIWDALCRGEKDTLLITRRLQTWPVGLRCCYFAWHASSYRSCGPQQLITRCLACHCATAHLELQQLNSSESLSPVGCNSPADS